MVTTNEKDTMIDLSKYFEMSEEHLEALTSTSIASPTEQLTYLFEVSGDLAGDIKRWESGNVTKSVKTVVAEGDRKGAGGPLLKLSFGAYVGPGEVIDSEERSRRDTVAEARFIKIVSRVTDGAALSLPKGTEEEVLAATAKALKGQRFVGIVAKKDSDFAKFAPNGIYSVGNPPKSYSAAVEAFQI